MHKRVSVCMECVRMGTRVQDVFVEVRWQPQVRSFAFHFETHSCLFLCVYIHRYVSDTACLWRSEAHV